MLTLGIDLSASPGKSSPYSLLEDEGVLRCLSSFKTQDELLQTLQEHRPDLIAIDAPMSLPLRLCCLEEDCQCALVPGQKGRAVEQKLASIGIGCFFTNKKSIIKTLIYRAIDLRRELAGRGYRVIEVYPYATKVILFGEEGLPAKSNPASLPFLREKLAALMPGLDPYVTDLNHDRCDALLAAYTGYLHLTDRTDGLGVEEEGLITMPKLTRTSYRSAPKKGTDAVGV